MTAVCALLMTLTTGQAKEPPLTPEQVTRLQQLVAATQEKSAALKKQLDAKQQELADRYAEFKLDASAVAKLQGEVLDLQKQLLDNYHHLQVEVRAIVGPERFAVLRQRLDRILGIPAAKDKKTPQPR